MYRVRRSDGRIEVEIEDETPEAVFREAIVALADEITEERGGGEPLAYSIEREAANLSGLLRDLLDELLCLARDESFIGERPTRLALAGTSVRAVIGGQRLAHDGTIASICKTEVFQAEDATWRARLVLSLN